MNFYQSDLRLHINTHIYKKPTFQVDFLGRTYTGIHKTKQKLGKQFTWYMVHGIELGSTSVFDASIQDSLSMIHRDFSKKRGDIFFQLGCIGVADTSTTKKCKDKKHADSILTQRKYMRSQLLEWYDLRPSWREHMPNATITLDLKNTLPVLKEGFSSSGKRYFNKAKKQELSFHEATEKEWSVFRDMRYAMAYDKGFSVVPKNDFLSLMSYLHESKQGILLLAKKGKNIVSGNVMLFVDDLLIYLYGATDRSFGPIGGHYRLMYETMRWGREHHFTTLDLFGIASPGEEEHHHLAGVTRFKQSFGGSTISYIGNYDLVFNKILYKTFKAMKR